MKYPIGTQVYLSENSIWSSQGVVYDAFGKPKKALGVIDDYVAHSSRFDYKVKWSYEGSLTKAHLMYPHDDLIPVKEIKSNKDALHLLEGENQG